MLSATVSWCPSFAGLTLLMIVLATVAGPARAGEAPPVENLMAYDPATLFNVVNGSVSKVKVDGQDVLRWEIAAGQSSDLSLKREHPAFARLRYFDRLQFDFRTASGAINTLEVKALGHVSGPRAHKPHQSGLAVLTTPKGEWLTREWDFNRPNWLPWTVPDGEGTDAYFMFSSLAMEPGTVVELRNVRLVRGLVQVKPFFEMPVTWPVLTRGEDGSATLTSDVRVLNATAGPTTIKARVASEHKRFKVTIEPAQVEVKNSATTEFKLTAKISKADIDASPELYAEPIRLAFASENAPEAEAWHFVQAVRPLSPGLRTQVLLSDADLAFVREKIAAGDADMKRLTDYARVIAAADKFLPIKLLAIPHSSSHVTNNLIAGWTVGDYMPEIVNTTTGERRAFTVDAMNHWKAYLAVPGNACEFLGMAYMLTGDEKYAQKAVELMALYGKQYSELPYNTWFGNPPGATVLGDGRVSAGSTYGSNWLFKGHLRMLSMVSGSKAWADADRAAIYKGFVLPYATELMKFNGGISNMTDITNHNLLLLGLIFNDAGLVRFATRSDPGLASRLLDLTDEGFSSEGRPVSYHFAGMSEYLPSISYIENSGLKIDYPRQRLPAAIRMSYQRATLTGIIPSTGDCGRGLSVRNQPLADYLSPIFPDEKWLAEVGGSSTLNKKVSLYRSGAKVNDEAWRSLLETTPRLFPQAGMAILRRGEKPQEQVMVTLDYGRNFFHAALDRLQLTLFAFGRTYSHGPGSVYNVGSGGMTRTQDKRLDSFCGHDSLGHNVVVVDETNQSLAIGRLLAWSDKPERQVAVATVDAVRPGVSHTRGVVLTQGVVFVLDRLQSNESHTYDFVYHNLGELKPPAEGWKATPLDKPIAKTGNYENIVDPQRLTGSGPVRLAWDLSNQFVEEDKWDGPKTLGLALWQVPIEGAEIYTGVTGMNNGNTHVIPDKAPTLISRVKGKSAQFLTVLEPHTGMPRVKGVSAKDGQVTAEFVDGTSVTMSLEQLIKENPAPAEKK